jgi:hypothetical protein
MPYTPLLAGANAAALNTTYNVAAARFAGSVLPAGAGNQPLAAAGLPFPFRMAVEPADRIMGPLFEQVVQGLAPQILVKNLDTFVTELAKLKNRPSDAQTYIAKAVKDFGLTLQAMAKPS